VADGRSEGDSGPEMATDSTGADWPIDKLENWRISAVQKLENRQEKPRFAGGERVFSAA
jgi:hypothetical protein